jgi:hypothetical protein
MPWSDRTCRSIVTLHGVAALAVIAWMGRYDHAPGAPSQAPAAGLPGVTVALHPRCPCSLATLDRLIALAPQLPPDTPLRILLAQPDGVTDPAWCPPELRRRLAALPQATTLADPEGRFSAAAGARTSGTVIVRAPDGAVLFQGGLTRARGDVTPSGLDQLLLAALAGSPQPITPVFGCALILPPSTP